MILYDSTVGGTFHELGTSGFLYRSNKMMYDKATQSLWNTLQGKPVIGDLVGKGILRREISGCLSCSLEILNNEFSQGPIKP